MFFIVTVTTTTICWSFPCCYCYTFYGTTDIYFANYKPLYYDLSTYSLEGKGSFINLCIIRIPTESVLVTFDRLTVTKTPQLSSWGVLFVLFV